MALTEVTIANMALSRLGRGTLLTGDVDGTLANCTDTSYAKDLLDLWYARKRDALLEMYPWTFARKYTTLTLNDAGSGEVWEDEWDNAYTYPSDAARSVRFVQDVGVGYGYGGYGYGHAVESRYRPMPWPFVVAIHDGAKRILTDVPEADAKVEYTALVTTASDFTEEFASGLAWLLAAEVGRPLSVDERRVGAAEEMARLVLIGAAASNRNETELRPESDGGFLQVRWGV